VNDINYCMLSDCLMAAVREIMICWLLVKRETEVVNLLPFDCIMIREEKGGKTKKLIIIK